MPKEPSKADDCLGIVAAREHLSDRGWHEAPRPPKELSRDLALIEGVVQAVNDVDLGQQTSGQASLQDIEAARALLSALEVRAGEYESLLRAAASRRSSGEL